MVPMGGSYPWDTMTDVLIDSDTWQGVNGGGEGLCQEEGGRQDFRAPGGESPRHCNHAGK